MGKINVLDKQMSELIAAGEVIDRPASVIKELVENAIDAGATQITVEIQCGGVTYMRVCDNGGGISPEDIRNAFLPHATSKLRIPDDLQGILTMGFRGEALASVAAMCRVEVLSRVPGENAGVRYRIEGGEEIECTPAGCPEGTTVVVRDIFYNTPARMKFLKKDVTEAGAVGAILDNLAVAQPHIAFQCIRDGKIVLQTPGGGKAADAVYAVWGREFYNTLTPIHFDNKGVRVRGFVSKPEQGRGNRTMQHFYVNTRFIRSRTCAAALEEAYRSSMMKGRFPACVLNILLPPSVYDINVHPAKLEVRFADEKVIFDAVYYGVKSAITQLDAQGVEAHLPIPSALAPVKANSFAFSPPLAPVVLEFRQSIPQEGGYATGGQTVLRETVRTTAQTPTPAPVVSAPQTPLDVAETPAPRRFENARLIGEVFETYLLLECGESIILIDKHAAHERLLYEQLKAAQEVRRQLLLEPITVTLAKEPYTAALEHLEVFRRLGFELEDFGGSCLMVREIPTMLALEHVRKSVDQLAQALAEGSGNPSVEALDVLYHTLACRAAIKAHDTTSAPEMQALVELLREHEDVRFCPHGRPIAVTISQGQLERMFGRA